LARVTLLVGGERGRFPFSNCLLVRGARASVLVDSGCGPDRLEAVRGRVDAVVYTHVHPDHVWGHGLLAGAKSHVPLVDAAYRSLEALAARYAPEIVAEWLGYAGGVFGLAGPPPADEVYGPWEEVRVGDVSIVAVPARGHTRGHTMILAGGHVHLSDVDLTGFGPWYGHPESSLEAFAADIDLARELAAESKAVSTSHRERVFAPGEALAELDAYTRALCRQVTATAQAAARAGGPVKPGDLAGRGVIYRRYAPGMEAVMRYFEEAMIEKILYFLASRGAARYTGRGFHVRPERVEGVCVSLLG